jgi:hypothetical protein
MSEERQSRQRRGIVITPKKGEVTSQRDVSILVVTALVAFFVSLPFFAGAIYDKFNPQSVSVDDRFVPTFEQFKIDTYEKMTDKDILFSGLDEEAKLRQSYDIIAAAHWNLVRGNTHRRLFMYGALMLASLAYLLLQWRKGHARGIL